MIVLVVFPVVTAAVIVLLSHIVCFTSKGDSGSVIVPEGVAIAGTAASRHAGGVITVVTVGLSGRHCGGGMAPHLVGDSTEGPLHPPPLLPATRPPGLGPGIQDGHPGGAPLQWLFPTKPAAASLPKAGPDKGAAGVAGDSNAPAAAPLAAAVVPPSLIPLH